MRKPHIMSAKVIIKLHNSLFILKFNINGVHLHNILDKQHK